MIHHYHNVNFAFNIIYLVLLILLMKSVIGAHFLNINPLFLLSPSVATCLADTSPGPSSRNYYGSVNKYICITIIT